MNDLISIAISHHTAELNVRERMWMSEDEAREAVGHLTTHYLSECVLLSTCNRTELYGISANGKADPGAITEFLIEFKNAATDVQPAHFTRGLGPDAVRHLFEVAAGIDSMVVGDIQILSQVKEAFQLSVDARATGPVLNRLMQSALHVGKRVRSETHLCEGAVSVSYAAVELASKIFEDLSRKCVLLIGAGETGELTMKHLVGREIGRVMIANRTRENAEQLATKIGRGEVVDYDMLRSALCEADIVVTSVTSPSYIVQPEHVRLVMKQRSHNPLFIIDIGVPRNVDPSCRGIDNVFLYDIDTLNSVVDQALTQRKGEIPAVQKIIGEEVHAFLQWQTSLEIGPTIHDFREALEHIREEEVEKNINRFAPQDRELVELLTKRIVNKILHRPTTLLRNGGDDEGMGPDVTNRVQVLRELFGINGKNSRSNEEAQ